MKTLLCLSLVSVLAACGSPEQYQKSPQEKLGMTDSTTAIGMGVGRDNLRWAQEFVAAREQSRTEFALGNVTGGLRISDSLIAVANGCLDTLSLNDPRARFLAFMLTELHTHAIMWQELVGDTADAKRRERDYEALGERIHRMRDSLDRLNP
jgi:hypothetical protein